MRTAITAFLLVVPLAHAQAGHSGHWVGSIQGPGNELGIEIDLVDNHGALEGSFSSPAQHLSGFPLANFSETGGSLSFQVRGSDRGERVFSGSFSEDGQKFSGTFRQLGYDLPFELVRSGDPRREIRLTSPAVAKTVEGLWKAVIESGAILTLTIANQPDGTAQATLLQTGEGLAIPVSQIKLSGSTLKLDLPAIGGVFVGEVAKDGTQIAGNYTGPDSNAEVIFRRADAGDAR